MNDLLGTLQNFFRLQVGIKNDPPDIAGNLHAKMRAMGSVAWPYCNSRFGHGLLGDVTINANTNLNPGIYQYQNLTINESKTLSIGGRFALLMIKDTLTINGLISASGHGGSGGAAVSVSANQTKIGNPGLDGTIGGGGGGGSSALNYASGGIGGFAGLSAGAAGVGVPGGGSSGGIGISGVLLPIDWLGYCGAGGGSGGAGIGNYSEESATSGAGGIGGGLIVIEARHIVINSSGAIRTEGTNGGNASRVGSNGCAGGGGGGGGGAILLIHYDIVNNGTLSVAGGTGGTGTNSNAGGAGGNGIVMQFAV